MTDPAMARLGQRVWRRRDEIGLSRAKAEKASGVGHQTWFDVEHGLSRKTGYSRANMGGIMRTCGWTPESWDLLLAGKEPVDLDTPPAVVVEEVDAATRLAQLEARVSRIVALLEARLGGPLEDPPSPPAS